MNLPKIYTHNPALVRHYLKPHFLKIAFVAILAVLLGVTASLVVALVGPGFKALMLEDRSTTLLLRELLGERWSAFLGFMGVPLEFSAEAMLQVLPFLLIVAAFSKSIFYLSQWFIWEKVGETVSLHLRQDLMAAFVAVEPTNRNEPSLQEAEENIASTLSTDIRMLREYLVHFYGGMPREAIQTIFMLVSLWLLSPQLFTVFIIGVLPTVVIIQRLGKKLRRRAGHALQNYSDLTEWLQQRLLGIETIKHYQSEQEELTKLKALTQTLFKKFFRAARVKARTGPLVETVAILSICAVFYYSFQLILEGELSGAIVMSFFSTLALLSQSANKLSRYFNQNREGSAATTRVRERFATFETHKNTDKAKPILQNPSGHIAVSIQQASVRFADVIAVDQVSTQFEYHKIHVVCGESGAGKTTLMKVLLGLQGLEKGKVTLYSEQRCPIGYVAQKVELPEISLAECVSYPNYPDIKKVNKCLSRVGLAELAEKHGLETYMGGKGVELSGGQMQRVMLARAIYLQSKILCLDEATSALDPESEQIIYNCLKELRDQGYCIILIAHRISALYLGDHILQMDKGRVSIEGCAEEVVEQVKSQYARKKCDIY